MKKTKEQVEISNLKHDLKDIRLEAEKVRNHCEDIQSKLTVALDALRMVSVWSSSADAPKHWDPANKVQWTAADALVRIGCMRLRPKGYL